MKIFNWMQRRLHCINNYSQVSQTKDAFGEDAEEKGETAVETDTDALLLHDMLNGILTIGTLGHHHPLVSQSYSDSEECPGEDGEEVQRVEQAAFFAVARDPSSAVTESFKIKISVGDEEKKIMEVVQVLHEVEGAEKILELPLLKEDKERDRRRTTLADLLAANAVSDLDLVANAPDGADLRVKHQQQQAFSGENMQHKKSKGNKPVLAAAAAAATTTKLQTLISRMMKKKIHPEMMAAPKEEVHKEGNKAERPPMVGQSASDSTGEFFRPVVDERGKPWMGKEQCCSPVPYRGQDGKRE